MKLNIIVNKKVIPATLNESDMSRDFSALLPLELHLNDYAGEEKISMLPVQLRTVDSPKGTEALKGDIMIFKPWGNLAIFYKDRGYVDGLIKLGQLDDPDALPLSPSSYSARFELME